jgi:oligoxyloglucan reducing-end-specific cellobiohydrolase
MKFLGRAVRALIIASIVSGVTGLCFSQDPLAPYVYNPVTIMAGGYVPGMIAHPTQPGLTYARTDIGGVYRWNPSTNDWTPLLDFNSAANYNLTGPESIAIDPTNPNNLYIAAGMYTTTSDWAFLVSTNQGESFSVYPETSFPMASNNDGRAAGERLAVNPFKPSELFMGTRSTGLWVSENYAQTWTKSATFPVASDTDGYGLQFVVFDPVNSGTIYVGSYSKSLVYVSKDDGATWNSLPAVNWPANVLSADAPSTPRAPSPERALINPDGNLYVTFDDSPGPNSTAWGIVEKYNPQNPSGGWTNITPPLDGTFQTVPRGGFIGLTQNPNVSGTIAVSTFNRYYPVDDVYITQNGGSTWTSLAYNCCEYANGNGVDGPAYGNYYYDSAVYGASPYLTFGDTVYQGPPTGDPYPSSRFGWWESAVLIDPINPAHIMYGTGATIYATDNLSAINFSMTNGSTGVNLGPAPTWYVQGQGIEETAVLALISPTSGAHLLSGVGDDGGFRHDDFTVSPLGTVAGTSYGMFTNPVASNVGSLDWAGQNPSVIVRGNEPESATTSPCTYGAYSNDGGTTWAPFPKCATGANSGNGGVVAVDAGGTMFMWTGSSGSSTRPSYSTNNGTTWTATTGLSTRVSAYADKVTPKLFYAFVSGTGVYSTTTTGGITFSKVNTSPAILTKGTCTYVTGDCGLPVANWAKAGDLWLPLGTNGLYHSSNAGVTWTQVVTTEVDAVAIGATVPSTTTQSVFIYGLPTVGAFRGIYRSDNVASGGSTWYQINDTNHQYGGPTVIAADPLVYGRVFLGMNGRGIIYIDPANPWATLPGENLDFGPITWGTRSAVQSVTLTNSGNTSLSVSSITVNGNYSETDNCTSEPIQANGTCTISVTFLPAALGDIPGTLTVNDNASNSPQTESLSGVGVPATLTAACASGSFIQGGVVPFFPVTITGIVIPASDSGPAVVHPDKPTGITSHCTLNTTLYPGLSNASAPGYYPNGLSPVVSGAPLANYIVVAVDGNLTINDTAIVARPVSKK